MSLVLFCFGFVDESVRRSSPTDRIVTFSVRQFAPLRAHFVLLFTFYLHRNFLSPSFVYILLLTLQTYLLFSCDKKVWR